MAVVAHRQDVNANNAVALIDGNDTDGAVGTVQNITGTAIIYLGGPDVDSVNGYPWDSANGEFAAELKAGEVLYGILANGQPVQTCAIIANYE